MQCSACRFWLTARVTDYEDGTRIFNFQSPEGKGLCESLKIETSTDFGCNRFEEGQNHIEIMGSKPGSPWHHSHYESCPDCKGTGLIDDNACGRCCRTGRCLFYDDGYIGEERTRRHPNEIEKGPPPPPTCQGCARTIDQNWFSCPWCGTRIAPDEPVRTSEFLT